MKLGRRRERKKKKKKKKKKTSQFTDFCSRNIFRIHVGLEGGFKSRTTQTRFLMNVVVTS